MELKNLLSFKYLRNKDFKLATQVEEVHNLVFTTINSISGCFNNFTMHDMNHGLRVASYMEQIAFGITPTEERMDQFSPLEIALLILTAILHDIGMFIRNEDKEEIRKGNIKYTNSLTYEGVLRRTNNEEEAIKEIIRITHAKRITEYINYKFENGKCIADYLKVNDMYSYADDVEKICQAHGESYNYIKDNLCTDLTKGSYSYNQQYLAAILRIADYIDLDKQRTPMLWYKMMGIDGFSKSEWEAHFQITNDTKFRELADGKMQIYFSGESLNPKIHRKYLKYIDGLKEELENFEQLFNLPITQEKYKIKLSTKVSDCMQTKGFKYSDLRLILDYSSITDLLMGTNIYGDCKLGLRELIQNSIDACKLAKEVRKNLEGYNDPEIFIKYSKEKNYVIIKDTGMGMTLEIIKNHFLNVGKSYYKSKEYIDMNYDYKPIGQYGIGFLACFLLSDNVIIKTRHSSSNISYIIELEKHSEYVVTKEENTSFFYGTEIHLEYTKFFKVFENETELKKFIEKYFWSDIKIQIKNDDLENSEILIKNQKFEDVVAFYNQKRMEFKIEEITCDKNNCDIYGKIYIRAKKDAKNSRFNSAIKKQKYVYDSNEKKLKLQETIDDGYYWMLKYALVDKEVYLDIKSKKRKKEEIFASLVSHGEKAKKNIYIFIRKNDDFPFNFIHQNNDDELNIIFQNSNLEYYRELCYLNCSSPIFMLNMEYIMLKPLESNNYRWRYDLSDEYESYPLYFYFKDVFVRKFDIYFYALPISYEIFGVIGSNNKEIKLDVSRNNIIFGDEFIKKAILIQILKHLIKNTTSTKFKLVYNKMIELEK